MITLEPFWIGAVTIATLSAARQLVNHCTEAEDEESETCMSGNAQSATNTQHVVPSPLIVEDTLGMEFDEGSGEPDAIERQLTPLHIEPPQREMVQTPPSLESPCRLTTRSHKKKEIQRSRSHGDLRNGESRGSFETTLSRSWDDFDVARPFSLLRQRSLESFLAPKLCQKRTSNCSVEGKELTPVASNKTRKALQSLNTTDFVDRASSRHYSEEENEDDDDELSFYNKSVYSFGQRVLQSYDDRSFFVLQDNQSLSTSSTVESLGENPLQLPPPPPPRMPIASEAPPLPNSMEIFLPPSWKVSGTSSSSSGSLPLVPQLNSSTRRSLLSGESQERESLFVIDRRPARLYDSGTSDESASANA